MVAMTMTNATKKLITTIVTLVVASRFIYTAIAVAIAASAGGANDHHPRDASLYDVSQPPKNDTPDNENPTKNRPNVHVRNNNYDNDNVVISQSLPTPYYGQHVGVAYADLNGDGAMDLLFAAGRHWMDQSYALINLGVTYSDDDNSTAGGCNNNTSGRENCGRGGFAGVRFSKALPIGTPGSYYQIDVVTKRPSSLSSTTSARMAALEQQQLTQTQKQQQKSTNNNNHDDEDKTKTNSITTKVLLVGGTCQYNVTNSFGSCRDGDNNAARVLHVTMANAININNDDPGNGGGVGCSIYNPDAECKLDWQEVWVDPNPRGDRNGGFAYFGQPRENNEGSSNNDAWWEDGDPSVVLLGQGGVEIFNPTTTNLRYQQRQKDQQQRKQSLTANSNSGYAYSPAFHLSPPNKTNHKSDLARYAGFAAGYIPHSNMSVIAAGRRSDYDAPQRDAEGNVIGINLLVYEVPSSLSTTTTKPAELLSNTEPPKNNAKLSSLPPLPATLLTSSSTFHFQSKPLPSNISGEPYPGNNSYSIQTTNYAFADINGDSIPDLLESTFLYYDQRIPNYPLPQRIHFLNENAQVMETMVVLESEEGDAGRSVTTGKIFGESELEDVVFASARGVVSVFANLGLEEDDSDSEEEGNGNGGARKRKWKGLELRGEWKLEEKGQKDCAIRDVAVVPMVQRRQRQIHQQRQTMMGGDVRKYDHVKADGKCWVGIVCALACEFREKKGKKRSLGKNHVFYIENDSVCEDGGDVDRGNFVVGNELLVADVKK